MNLLDLIIVALAVSAAIGGFRLGLVARALSWAGMGLGLVLAAKLLPTIMERIQGPDPTGRLMVAAGVLLGGAFIGQAIGLVVGSRVHLVLPPGSRPLDQAAGAITGVFGVIISVWLLLPTMASVPGDIARQARTSSITRVIATTFPDPPDTLQALRRLVGDTPFPEVFSGLRAAPDTGPPPAESGLTKETLDRSVASSARIEAPACGRIQEGSGVVVEPGVVVTNAHVVAGAGPVTVETPGGGRVPADVVMFDPDRDIAVLSAPDVDEPPLPIGDPGVGTRGAVLGYPGGGPLRVAPFEVREEVQAVGRDLYDRHTTRRQVLILASNLAPGDSGGALVDPKGDIVGIAFAIAPDRPGTSYALDTTELQTALREARSADTDTGPCLA